MAKRWVISADSHVVEPDDLWSKPLGSKYGDNIPRVVNERGGEKGTFLYTGIEHVNLAGALDVDDETVVKLDKANRDPTFRLECLDEDGVYGELLCATTMMLALRARDDDMVRDCCAVFNDWLTEYCSQAPKRLYGTAMIHMENPDWAVKELDRVIKKGMSCVMPNVDTRPEWPPYQNKVYDAFWARAEEASMPVMLHIVTGNKQDPFTLFGEETKDVTRFLMEIFTDGPIVLANEFMFGGIMDRFPNLRLVLGEYEISWLPYWMFRAEQAQDIFMPMIGGEKRKHTVREYLGRVYQGVIDDPYFEKAMDLLDINTLMWGSDFPHPRCTYPNSHKIIDEKFGHLDAESLEKISLTNAVGFYNMELPAEYAAAAAE